MARNIERRHLDESQRAMYAARLAKLGSNQYTREGAQICAPSQSEAADRLHVSRRHHGLARSAASAVNRSVIAETRRSPLPPTRFQGQLFTRFELAP